MASTLPPQIRVQAVRDDVTYVFPIRPLGVWRLLGFLPMAFAAVFISVPISMLHGMWHEMWGGKTNIYFACGLTAFISLFVIAGLTPFLYGLCALAGHSRIEWKNGRLIAVERAGPIFWRRRLSRRGALVRKLSVESGTRVQGRPVAAAGIIGDMGYLRADFDRGKARTVATGYPREWLQAVADDLSARIGATPGAATAPVVETIDDSMGAAEQESIEKPVDSHVEVETSRGGIILTVPPVGVWKANKGIILFAIVWCGFMTFFTSGTIFGPAKSKVPVAVVLFITAFWGVGVGLLLLAFNTGRRRAMLQVRDGQLKIVQRGIFGARQWAWSRDDITAVRMDFSGMEVNHQPLLNLQIHLTTGKHTGFFAGRDEGELEWMASQLRRALNVPADKYDRSRSATVGGAGQSTADELAIEKPPKSRATVETNGGEYVLTVPSAGVWRGSAGMFPFSIIWCGFMTFFTWGITHSNKKQDMAVFGLFIAAFWTIGIGMFVGGFALARRRAVFRVRDGQLSVVRQGLFGTRQWAWGRGEIAAVRAHYSGMRVNNQPVINLQIHPVSGNKVCLFGGRDRDELYWMAAELRRALGVPEE